MYAECQRMDTWHVMFVYTGRGRGNNLREIMLSRKLGVSEPAMSKTDLRLIPPDSITIPESIQFKPESDSESSTV